MSTVNPENLLQSHAICCFSLRMRFADSMMFFFQQHASFDCLAHEADLNWLLKVVAFSKSTSLQGG
jgi:hypothetical protein